MNRVKKQLLYLAIGEFAALCTFILLYISLNFALNLEMASFIIWVIVGIVDYLRVKSFEKPIFSIPISAADDSGSGTYQGVGYSFEIKGNFMPEDEFPGVTYYKYYLFGNFVKDGLKD